YLRRSTRARLLHFSHSNRKKSRAASTSVVSDGFIPAFEQSDMRAGSALDAFAIENSVVNGGVSDTARSQVGQINEVRIWDLPATLARSGPILFHVELPNGSSMKMNSLEEPENSY